MDGEGGASSEDVMLMDGRRVRRTGEASGEECWECGIGILRVPDAEEEAASAIAENVARNREKDGAFVIDGRLPSIGSGGGVYTGSTRTAPSPKSPSSSLDERYIEPQLG